MSQWIGNAITAAATISVAGIAIIGNYFNNRLIGKNEKKKFKRQREMELEKINLEFQKKINEQKFQIYNNVLKIDGEYLILKSVYPHLQFDQNEYEEHLRPVLYKEYHILDEDIRNIILSIDNIIKQCDFEEEVSDENNEYFVSEYGKLIKEIRRKYVF